MRVLDLKLLRDLRRLWPQALAIALVMACGVATLIIAMGAFRSLDETRAAYYERYLFGDVFASATRAPNRLGDTIAAIPGVAAVETRIVTQVLLDIADMREPASALVISLPDLRQPRVNALFLRQGRLPEPGRTSEVAVSEAFAEAHDFMPGSDFSAILNGSRTTLTVVGIVLSPEHVYVMAPGEILPDPRRFGVFWMAESALAPLFDLEGAFNSVSLRLLPGADEQAVIDDLDEVLDRYGGQSAYGRDQQMSNAFLDSELTQLRGMAVAVPPIFLLVSAFLINMILTRLIALEREQIGLLKALGYTQIAVAVHYLKLVVAIAVIGIVIGFAFGTWGGRAMTDLYSEYYSFPFLLFSRSPDIYVIAALVSVAAAIVGAVRAATQAFALPAAVAMRPPAPPLYRRLFGGFFDRLSFFSQLAIMAVRNMLRAPVRAGLTTLGTAFAVSLLVVGLSTLDSMDYLIDAIYFRAQRQDATLTFAAAKPPEAILSVARLPGIIRAEPQFSVPVRFRNGHLTRQVGIEGKPPATDLSRVLDLDLQPVVLPETGIALGDYLARLLDVRRGDSLTVELLDGSGRVQAAPVTEIIQTYLGLTAYMDIDALARLAGTGPRVTGADVEIDAAVLDELYAALKRTPQIGGASLLTASRQAFQETLDRSIGITTTIYVVLAVIIAFGVVYNSARIQLSERARDLATLRVIGFSRREVSKVLFIELGAIAILAQPLGWLLGVAFALSVITGLESDLFRIPFVVEPSTFAMSSLVVLAAIVVSALIVDRRVGRLDLIAVLKTRE